MTPRRIWFELALIGGPIHAQRAYEVGLVNRIARVVMPSTKPRASLPRYAGESRSRWSVTCAMPGNPDRAGGPEAPSVRAGRFTVGYADMHAGKNIRGIITF
ncbi:MAG: hypothetical protein ACYDGN_17825 [Acidimicrobiales bacterium]